MTEQDFSKFQGKKVIVTRNLAKPNEKGETAVEIEGTAHVANERGILLKPKGKPNMELFAPDEIEQISYAPEKAKKLGRKVLKDVEYGQARSHLLERHAETLDAVNTMTEEDALDFHEAIDHIGMDLGHSHGDKNATERGEAVAEAEAE